MMAAAAPPLAGTVRLKEVGGQRREVSLPLAGGRPLVLRLPPRSLWELQVDSPGHWAKSETVATSTTSEPLTRPVEVWPAARIRGRLTTAGKEDRPPTQIALGFESPPTPRAGGRIRNGRSICLVDREQVFVCEAPALTLDLAIRADGFVPSYRFGLALQPGKELDLNLVTLRRGASVAGWAEVPDGVLAAEKCTAWLYPAVAPGGTSFDTTERLRRASLTAPVKSDGFFQFAGVPAGTYTVQVDQPGFAPGTASPIEVYPLSETLLRHSIQLRRPLTIEVALSPPVDWLGQPWALTVWRASDFSANYEGAPAFQGPVPRDGRVAVRGQTPGAFLFEVKDSLGNSLVSEEGRPVEGPEVTQVRLEVPLVWVSGTVTYGKDPLQASLEFGGRHGAVRVMMESDEAGEFEGVLPRGGRWPVDVEAPEDGIDTRVETRVKPNAEGQARLELRIPDTQISGRVLAEGGPLPEDTRVTLSSPAGARQKAVGRDGEFEFRGTPPGRVALHAEAFAADHSEASEPSFVEVLGSGRHGPINLLLQRNKRFSGRVLGARGPVAGAVVVITASVPRSAFGVTRRTDLNGEFVAHVPYLSQQVTAVVSPPGHALTAFEVPATAEPVELPVTEEGGHLDVSLPISQEQVGETGQRLLLLQNGTALPFSTLFRWARGHGVEYFSASGEHLPQLAPGQYTACLLPRDLLISDEPPSPAGRQGNCATGYLSLGGQLHLTLEKR